MYMHNRRCRRLNLEAHEHVIWIGNTEHSATLHSNTRMKLGNHSQDLKDRVLGLESLPPQEQQPPQ